MTRVPVPVLLRWPSWMRSDPRSAFPEISELAMVPPTPCIDAKTQLRLRTTEPKNYTDGSVQDRGTHIVTQPSAIRAEIPLARGGRPGRKRRSCIRYRDSGLAGKRREGVQRCDSAEESRYGIEGGHGRLLTGRRQPFTWAQRYLRGEKP